MKKIGFIGVGIMGKSMVKNLMKAGFELHIYARTKSKVNDVIEEGAIFHETIGECVRASEAVITMVGFPQDVEEVYFDEGNIMDQAEKGMYLIDMTTTSPMISKKIYEEGKKKGVHVVDAPVTGGDTGAKAGTLSILVGGNKEDYEACMPLFEAMGTNINYQGEAGCGQHAKMVNQIMIAGTLSGVCEALTYAKAKSGRGTSVSLKALSDRYPGVNFTTNTQNFSQKGTNNIQIAPNILVQMQNDPDKRVEYEALIYDCAQLVYSGKMSQGGMGYHIKAAGTVINADGSVSGWSIAEDDDGGQTRNSTKLDKDKKDTWADKIHEKQKAKSEKARKEAAARLQEQMNGTEMKSYADNLFLSQAGMDSYNQLSSVSYQDYVNRFESEVSEVYEKDGNADAVKSDSFDQHVNRMAAAYDKMKNSIEEKYAKEDHKTEYHHFSMTR